MKLYLAGILLLLSAMFAHGADETLKMIAGFIILWWAKDNMPRGKSSHVENPIASSPG